MKENIDRIYQSIAKVAAGKEVKVIAVTKTITPEVVDEALAAGIEYIGENKIQEAERKLPLLKNKFQEFHYIGHLQKNKIKKLLALEPALIHSMDSLSTLNQLNKYLIEIDKYQDILVQVNTSEEESKFGLRADETELSRFMEKALTFNRIRIKGLMTIAEYSNDEKVLRLCFSKLKRLFDKLNETLLEGEMNVLSMGMSNDYLTAIEEGANMVRIGSAIFGERNYNKGIK